MESHQKFWVIDTEQRRLASSMSYYEPICLLTNDQLTGQTAPRYPPSPSAAAAGVLNLTNYNVVRMSGILLVCSQTLFLYKLTFNVQLNSDPEREREITWKTLKPDKRDRMPNYGQGNLKYICVWASEQINTVVMRFICVWEAPVYFDSDRNAQPAMKDNVLIENILNVEVVHSTLTYEELFINA